MGGQDTASTVAQACLGSWNFPDATWKLKAGRVGEPNLKGRDSQRRGCGPRGEWKGPVSRSHPLVSHSSVFSGLVRGSGMRWVASTESFSAAQKSLNL